jgi:tetratricopeptide (TPR) repeat protein
MACRRGRFASSLHHWDEARSWLQLARSLAPDDPQAWLDTARLELETGHPRQALAAAEHLLNLYPLTPPALVLQAKAHLALSDLEAAAADLQVLNFTPTSFETWLLQGQLAEARGDFAAASRHYQTALTSASTPAALYGPMVWGRSALATDRVPFLLQPAQAGAMVECYLALGHLYARQGMTDAARQAYQSILRIDPGRVEARQGLERLP